ncbi:MAG: YeiH family protein [Rhodospirillaceae bacterium]
MMIRLSQLPRYLPGIALCAGVSLAASALEAGEAALFGHAWLEALVLAILLGAAIRTAWTPGPAFRPGINASAKLLLEIAVVLLGASVSFATVMAAGPKLLVGIVGVVAFAILFSFSVGRILGLHTRLALLVACGNSICGNSAIAAVAPVIGADGDDVASSIAFTAVLGVVVVLTLPLLVTVAGLSNAEYGVLAGLTVYAVPQVLAATAPVSALSVQVGTLVKLVRVLMLGPVVLVLSLLESRLREEPENPAPMVTAGDRPKGRRVAIHRLVPWFIIGFMVLAACRSTGLLPAFALPPMAKAANVLTVLSMAALGLGVDVRTVAQAGPKVTTAVIVSLLALGSISLALIEVMR